MTRVELGRNDISSDIRKNGFEKTIKGVIGTVRNDEIISSDFFNQILVNRIIIAYFENIRQLLQNSTGDDKLAQAFKNIVQLSLDNLNPKDRTIIESKFNFDSQNGDIKSLMIPYRNISLNDEEKNAVANFLNLLVTSIDNSIRKPVSKDFHKILGKLSTAKRTGFKAQKYGRKAKIRNMDVLIELFELKNIPGADKIIEEKISLLEPVSKRYMELAYKIVDNDLTLHEIAFELEIQPPGISSKLNYIEKRALERLKFKIYYNDTMQDVGRMGKKHTIIGKTNFKDSLESLIKRMRIPNNAENISLIKENIKDLIEIEKMCLELIYRIFEDNNLTRSQIEAKLGIAENKLYTVENKAIDNLRYRICNKDFISKERDKSKAIIDQLAIKLDLEPTQEIFEKIREKALFLSKTSRDYLCIRYQLFEKNNLTRGEIHELFKLTDKSDRVIDNFEAKCIQELRALIAAKEAPKRIHFFEKSIYALTYKLGLPQNEESYKLVRSTVELLSPDYRVITKELYGTNTNAPKDKYILIKELGISEQVLTGREATAIKKLAQLIANGGKIKEREKKEKVARKVLTIIDLATKLGLGTGQENLDNIKEYINYLNENQKMLLSLKYNIFATYNLTNKEIADKLGFINMQAYYNTEYTAVKRLKSKIINKEKPQHSVSDEKSKKEKHDTIAALAILLKLEPSQETFELIKNKVVLLKYKERRYLELKYQIFENNNLDAKQIAYELGVEYNSQYPIAARAIKRLKFKIDTNDMLQDTEEKSISVEKVFDKSKLSIGDLVSKLGLEPTEDNFELIREKALFLSKDRLDYLMLRYQLFENNQLTYDEILKSLDFNPKGVKRFDSTCIDKLKAIINSKEAPKKIIVFRNESIYTLVYKLGLKQNEKNYKLIREIFETSNLEYIEILEEIYGVVSKSPKAKYLIAENLGIQPAALYQIENRSRKKLAQFIANDSKKQVNEDAKQKAVKESKKPDSLSTLAVKVRLGIEQKDLDNIKEYIVFLSEKCRTLLDLKYNISETHNLTNKEILKKMSIKTTRALNYLELRAIKRLRYKIENNDKTQDYDRGKKSEKVNLTIPKETAGSVIKEALRSEETQHLDRINDMQIEYLATDFGYGKGNAAVHKVINQCFNGMSNINKRYVSFHCNLNCDNRISLAELEERYGFDFTGSGKEIIAAINILSSSVKAQMDRITARRNSNKTSVPQRNSGQHNPTNSLQKQQGQLGTIAEGRVQRSIQPKTDIQIPLKALAYQGKRKITPEESKHVHFDMPHFNTMAECKEYTEQFKGKWIIARKTMSRNYLEEYVGILKECHPNIFIISAKKPGNRFSSVALGYSDIIMGDVSFKLLEEE